MFTVGGKEDLIINGKKLVELPKALVKFMQNINQITQEFVSTDIEKLNDIWHTDFITRNEVNSEWVDRIIYASIMIYNFGTFNFKKWIEDEISTATNSGS